MHTKFSESIQRKLKNKNEKIANEIWQKLFSTHIKKDPANQLKHKNHIHINNIRRTWKTKVIDMYTIHNINISTKTHKIKRNKSKKLKN